MNIALVVRAETWIWGRVVETAVKEVSKIRKRTGVRSSLGSSLGRILPESERHEFVQYHAWSHER